MCSITRTPAEGQDLSAEAQDSDPRSQISELLKPSDPRSKIPEQFDHSDAKALRSEINFIDFSWILEPSGGHFGTSGASWRASWRLVTPKRLPGPSWESLGQPPGPSWSRFWSQLGPNLRQHGANLAPTWSQHAPNLIPSWLK